MGAPAHASSQKTSLLLFPMLYAAGAGVLATAVYLFSRAARRSPGGRRARPLRVDLAPVGFVVTAVASAAASGEPRLAWGSVAVIAIMLLTYWLLLSDLEDGIHADGLLHHWVLGAVVLAILGINGFMETRMVAASAWTGKNGMGTLLAASLPLVQLYALRGRDRAVAALAVVLVSTSLLLTMSLGAWVGAAAAQFILLLGHRSLRPAVFRAALAGLVALSLVAAYAAVTDAPAWGLVVSRLDPNSSSKTERILIWKASWAMWRDHPWLGVGPGAFSAVYPRYRLPEATEPVVAFAHNLLLNTLAEMGIFGLLGLGTMIGTWYLRAARAMRTGRDPALVAALLASLSALLVHQLFDGTAWSLQAGIGLWFLGAWMTHLAQPAKEVLGADALRGDREVSVEVRT